MNAVKGIKLFGFKLLILLFIVLAFIPPFSFANLGLGAVGAFLTSKAIESIVRQNQDFKVWLFLSILMFLILGIVVYENY